MSVPRTSVIDLTELYHMQDIMAPNREPEIRAI